MNTFSKEILELRNRIPIGIQEGLQLLKKHVGKIDLAEKEFISHRISILQSKHSIDEELALAYLRIYNFDIQKCLKKIEEDRYTFTELILRSKKKPEDKIFLIYQRMVEIEGWENEAWISLDRMKELNEPSYTLMLLNSFLDYCEWEGFSSALRGEKTAAVIKVLEKNFPGLAMGRIIRVANDIALSLYEATEKEKLDKLEKYTSFHKALSAHQKFTQLENEYEKNLPSLYEHLLEYVAENQAAFPN